MRLVVALCVYFSSLSLPADSKPNANDADGLREDAPFNRPWVIPDVSDLGLTVIDGDVVVPANDTLEKKGLDFDSFLGGLFKWRNGIVYYWFGEGLTSRHKSVIQVAMDHWEENTCLKFERAGSRQFYFYINFRADRNGCYSRLGRFLLGQDINLGSGCETVRTAIHEIGHAIGFHHEHSRSDRDQFVKILWHNLKKDWASQLEAGDDNPLGVPYDYSSIMHYGADAASAGSDKNTIVTLDPFLQLSLGNDRLSFRDRKLANLMYTCNEKCPNRDTLKCENEGFMFQRYGQTGNCSCNCPPNTSGDRCETLLDRSYYDYPTCGGNVTAEGTIGTPDTPYPETYDGKCIFWIQAPEGKVPQVSFSEFIYPERFFGCTFGRVEIRTADIYEGPMYCGSDLKNSVVTSTTRHMIIIAAPSPWNRLSGEFRGTVSFLDAPKDGSTGV